MALDHAREFAERRAIVLPSAAAPARQVEMFDGLTLAPRPERTAPSRERSLHDAVVRLSNATAEIVRLRAAGLAESPRQTAKLHPAAGDLNQLRPSGARDLRAAIVPDMQMVDDAAGGRTAGALKARNWESRFRTDPQVRADHFIRTWRQLANRHEASEQRGNERAANGVGAQMAALAKTLERDPQLEFLLRHRSRELGVPPYIDRPLAQALPDLDWSGVGARARAVSSELRPFGLIHPDP